MVNLAVLCLHNKDLGNIQFSLKSNYTPFELICDTKERGRHVVFGPTLYCLPYLPYKKTKQSSWATSRGAKMAGARR